MKSIVLSLLMMASFGAEASKRLDACSAQAWQITNPVKRDKAMMKCFRRNKRRIKTASDCFSFSNEVANKAGKDKVKKFCVRKFKRSMTPGQCFSVASGMSSAAAQDEARMSCLKAAKDLTSTECLVQAHTMNNKANNNAASEYCLSTKRSDLNMSTCFTAANNVSSEKLSDELKMRCVGLYAQRRGRVACEQMTTSADEVAPVVSYRMCCSETVSELYFDANKPLMEKRCSRL